eukprot:TRINITY_DN6835_c0_g1_i1.p1 TRINITY_DN6835_c0_g1~~TRINITY_DN6835_c0_g1_i1.p1  ORF type:complete len:112 (+),score=49.58 TRINITY_DN6835_c0_g1_i1:17-352(+)
MIRRPPRSTLSRSSAASDVYKRQRRVRDCPVVVQEPLNGVEDIGLTEFEERLADAVTCGALRDNIAAVDTRLAVYSLAVARRAATAVSYTHLRAHETVLDLVCRLLLEKKK